MELNDLPVEKIICDSSYVFRPSSEPSSVEGVILKFHTWYHRGSNFMWWLDEAFVLAEMMVQEGHRHTWHDEGGGDKDEDEEDNDDDDNGGDDDDDIDGSVMTSMEHKDLPRSAETIGWRLSGD